MTLFEKYFTVFETIKLIHRKELPIHYLPEVAKFPLTDEAFNSEVVELLANHIAPAIEAQITAYLNSDIEELFLNEFSLQCKITSDKNVMIDNKPVFQFTSTPDDKTLYKYLRYFAKEKHYLAVSKKSDVFIFSITF